MNFIFLELLLPSGASLCIFSLKTNKWCSKKCQWVSSIFYLKELQSGSLESFNSSWLQIQNFCFEAETILRAFNAWLGTVGTFSMFVKTRGF